MGSAGVGQIVFQQGQSSILFDSEMFTCRLVQIEVAPNWNRMYCF